MSQSCHILKQHDILNTHTARQVQDLEDQLQEKTDAYGILQSKQELVERDLTSQLTTSNELRDMIKQLEAELDAKSVETNDVREVTSTVSQAVVTEHHNGLVHHLFIGAMLFQCFGPMKLD